MPEREIFVGRYLNGGTLWQNHLERVPGSCQLLGAAGQQAQEELGAEEARYAVRTREATPSAGAALLKSLSDTPELGNENLYLLWLFSSVRPSTGKAEYGATCKGLSSIFTEQTRELRGSGWQVQSQFLLSGNSFPLPFAEVCWCLSQSLGLDLWVLRGAFLLFKRLFFSGVL